MMLCRLCPLNKLDETDATVRWQISLLEDSIVLPLYCALVTDHFSGPGGASSRVCVRIRATDIELNDF